MQVAFHFSFSWTLNNSKSLKENFTTAGNETLVGIFVLFIYHATNI